MATADSLRIERADFADPPLAEFLQAHLDDIAPTAIAESQHALDLSGLNAPGVRLWLAVSDIASVGFVHCPPFGAYREDPSSVFMTKHV